MFRRALVATDFSEASLDAVREALEIVKDGELAICHVIPDGINMQPLFPQDAQVDVTALIDFESRVRDELARIIEEIVDERDKNVTLFVERGEPYAEVLRRAEAWGADLVVTGSHGKGSTPLVGHVAERVVRYAQSPVLVVRRNDSKAVVLAATDLSDPSLPAVRAGAAEARRRGARFVLLHVIDIRLDVYAAAAGGLLGAVGAVPTATLLQEKNRALYETLKTAIEREQIDGEPMVLEGEPAACIVSTAAQLGAELVVVGTHGRTGLARIALGSVAEKVLRGAPSSVLAVRLTPG
jgi:nucleotide-binding universal stress UspA family protein